ncbi:MAG TPA: hypothetical protein VLC98_08300 [Phnomibacter sp.]|nr:hypothetical protein [Phnomibacter sp.]
MKNLLSSTKLLLWVLLAFTWVGCQKELSDESGSAPPSNDASGVLNGSPGTCANFVLNGAYTQGLAVDTANYVTVEMNFTTTGGYVVKSDTVNGVSFTGSGTVNAAGIVAVKMLAAGTPLNPGAFTYTVNFKGSSCSFTLNAFQQAVATTGDYFPMTANSWWTYMANDPAATPTDTAYTLSTGMTGTISITGNTYNLFTTEVKPDKDSSFYRKTGGDYIEFGDLDVLGITDLPVLTEWIFLKDNVAKGTQWMSPEAAGVSGTAQVKIRIKYEILEKDVNVVLDGKVYAKTIKVKNTQQVQTTAGGPFTDVESFETWFSKGIGLINVVVAAPIYGYRVVKYKVN